LARRNGARSGGPGGVPGGGPGGGPGVCRVLSGSSATVRAAVRMDGQETPDWSSFYSEEVGASNLYNHSFCSSEENL